MIPPPPIQQQQNGGASMTSPPSRPASKKQRANGGTPVGTKNNGPPPPQFRNVSLSTTGNRNSTSSSNSGRDPISDQTGDAIARRRAELRRLQQQRTNNPTMGGAATTSSVGGAPNVLEMSRMMFGGTGGHTTTKSSVIAPRSKPKSKPSPPVAATAPPPMASAPSIPPSSSSRSTKGIPPEIPPAKEIMRARSSDIFKTAPKLVDSPMVVSTPAPVARRLDDSFEHSYPDLTTTAESGSTEQQPQKQQQPPKKDSMDTNHKQKEPPATKKMTPLPVAASVPPPPKASVSFDSRSKSAPRARPPPPPMMTVRAKEAPAAPTTTPTTLKVPSKANNRVVMDSTAAVRRPTPVVPRKIPTKGTPHPGLRMKKPIVNGGVTTTTTPPVLGKSTTTDNHQDSAEKEIDIIPIRQQQSPECQVEPKSAEAVVHAPKAVTEKKFVPAPPVAGAPPKAPPKAGVVVPPKKDPEATAAAVAPEMEHDLGKHTPFPKKKQSPVSLSLENSVDKESMNGMDEDAPNSGVSSPPTTPRRDLLRNLREFADTPPPLAEEEKKEAPTSQCQSQPPVIIAGEGVTTAGSSTNGSSNSYKKTNELRLVQQLRVAHEAKTEALRKVARLEGEMQRMNSTKSMPSLETLVQVADQKGATEACEWARQQVVSTKGGGPPPQHAVSQVGFLSPMNTSRGSPVNRLDAMSPLVSTPRVGRKRVATPHPKRRVMTKEEKQKEREFLTSATRAVPFEYTSSLATYLVRQPYLEQPALGGEGGIWDTVGIVSYQDYPGKTDVGKPQTIEILAKITADGSTLSLSGKCMVRHQKSNDAPNKWKVYDNVDEMDKPLGCVMYIDGDANEKEYWLDAIYEEALATREAYCSSIISTASALQAAAPEKEKEMNPPKAMNAPPMASMQPPPAAMMPEKAKPQVADACVGTEDMPFPRKQQAQAQPHQGGAGGQGRKEDGNMKKPPSSQNAPPGAEKKSPPPAPEESDDASHDVLSIMLANVFQFFFMLMWSVFVRFPAKLMTFGFLIVMNGFLLHLVWMFLADDHGAQRIGAGIHSSINPPGLF